MARLSSVAVHHDEKRIRRVNSTLPSGSKDRSGVDRDERSRDKKAAPTKRKNRRGVVKAARRKRPDRGQNDDEPKSVISRA